MSIEIYRNFIDKGGASPNLKNPFLSVAEVLVPREREKDFLQQFPGSEIYRGESSISVEQIQEAARATLLRPVKDIAYTADVIQLDKARFSIAIALTMIGHQRTEPLFAQDVDAILTSRRKWRTEDFEYHWSNKGVGGLSSFYFDRLIPEDSLIQFYVRQDEIMKPRRATIETIRAKYVKNEADRYQLDRCIYS